MRGIDYMRQALGLREIEDKLKIEALLRSQAHNNDIVVDPSHTPWCSAMVNYCERAAGGKGTGKLNARSWLTYGTEVKKGHEQKGDIVIFDFEHDGIHGHVSYLEVSDNSSLTVRCLGGNQHNKVCYAVYPQPSIIGIRRGS